MVIAVRTDKNSPLENLPLGLSAKLVSEAVIFAYQKAQETDPVSVSQWEINAWPKIVVKCRNEKELREVEEKAKSNSISNYTLYKESSSLGFKS